MTLALSGCGGSAVSVRSNFASGAPAVSSGPSVPSGQVAQGLNAHYSGSGNLGLAILGIVIVADLVNWTATRLRYAFGGDPSPDPQAVQGQPQIRMPAKCVYPVPEMC